MESILKMVYSSQDVNLESQKVELASGKDLNSAVNKAEKMAGNAEKLVAKAKTMLTDALRDYKESRMELSKAVGIYDDIAKQLKDLDVPMPSEISSKGDFAKQKESEFKQKMTEIQSSRNSI